MYVQSIAILIHTSPFSSNAPFEQFPPAQSLATSWMLEFSSDCAATGARCLLSASPSGPGPWKIIHMNVVRFLLNARWSFSHCLYPATLEIFSP